MRVVVAATLVACASCATSDAYDHAAELAVLGGKADGNVATKRWTFLLYGAADNDLAASILRDVNELESVGSTDEVNLLAFLDTPRGARVHYLLADRDLGRLDSPSVDWGMRDSGDVQTLVDVADWAIAGYPAERYALIVSGHGGGSPRVIAPDYSSGHAIAVAELPRAIDAITRDTRQSIELFGADACLMQTTEVGYELRGRVNYVVASENTEPAAGWDYADIAAYLTRAPTLNGQQVGWHMIDAYAREYMNSADGAMLSMVRPRAFLEHETITSKLEQLASTLITHAATDAGQAELLAIADRVHRVYADDYADLGDLVHQLEQSSSAAVAAQAAIVKAAIFDLVELAWTDITDPVWPAGISIYFPAQATASDVEAYAANYALPRDIRWNAVVRAIHAR